MSWHSKDVPVTDPELSCGSHHLLRSHQRHCERLWHFLNREGIVDPLHYTLSSRPFIQGLSLEPSDLEINAQTKNGKENFLSFSDANDLLEWVRPMMQIKLGTEFSLEGWQGFVNEVLSSVHNAAMALAARDEFEAHVLRRVSNSSSKISNVDFHSDSNRPVLKSGDGISESVNFDVDKGSINAEKVSVVNIDKVTSALIQNDNSNLHIDSIWAMLRSASSLSHPIDSESELLFWEQLSAFEGHPLHPGSKCKVGWTDEQVLNYSPEFTLLRSGVCKEKEQQQQQHQQNNHGGVNVLLAAGKADRIAVSVSPTSIRGCVSVDEITRNTGMADWESLLPRGAYSRWCKWLRQDLQLDPSDYVPIPIHPGHMSSVCSRFTVMLTAGDLVIGENCPTAECAPTLSFRTLVPMDSARTTYVDNASISSIETNTNIVQESNGDLHQEHVEEDKEEDKEEEDDDDEEGQQQHQQQQQHSEEEQQEVQHEVQQEERQQQQHKQQQGSRWHMKLPVSVQATSLQRYVSPVEAHDSPLLTTMLQEMLSMNSFFQGSLWIMGEDVGMYLNYLSYSSSSSPSTPTINSSTCTSEMSRGSVKFPVYEYEDGRYLSAIYRESIADVYQSRMLPFWNTESMQLAEKKKNINSKTNIDSNNDKINGYDNNSSNGHNENNNSNNSNDNDNNNRNVNNNNSKGESEPSIKSEHPPFLLPLAGLFCRDVLASTVGTATEEVVGTATEEVEAPCALVSLLRNVVKVPDAEAARAYFGRYARVVLKGQLGMWLKCGVVLEAHQQNCVLAIDSHTGELLATIHRDLCGGLCGNADLIEALGFTSIVEAIHPRQDYLYYEEPEVTNANDSDSQDEEDVGEYDYMLGAWEHTVLRSHLFPVAKVIANEFSDTDVRCRSNEEERQAMAARMYHMMIRHDLRDIVRDLIEQEVRALDGLSGDGANGLDTGMNDLHAGMNGLDTDMNGLDTDMNGLDAGMNELENGMNGSRKGLNAIMRKHLKRTEEYMLGRSETQFKCLLSMRCLATKDETYVPHVNELVADDGCGSVECGCARDSQ